jgi:hypothetical protein
MLFEILIILMLIDESIKNVNLLYMTLIIIENRIIVEAKA